MKKIKARIAGSGAKKAAVKKATVQKGAIKKTFLKKATTKIAALPKKVAATTSANNTSAVGQAPLPRLRFDAAKVVKEVLRLSETGQHEKILCVLGDEVGPDTGAMVARRAFLRISMLIHPDKLPGVPEATKAFQALVAAFDYTQQKGLRVDTGLPQHATLSRSNEGCFKHEILCPRCEGPWGKKVEGNPDYYYNFMMEGLKSFTCSSCLLKFGCLTAIHLCPFCKNVFEYYPDQYHKKITCGSPYCGKRFGFAMFHASERALTQARHQVRAEFEAECRRREQNAERHRRLARRLGNFDRTEFEEKCFAHGLRDTCPRCGLDLSRECGDEHAQLRHLRSCTDSRAHRIHQQQEQRKAAEKALSEKKATAQHNAAAKAVFTFCGGGSSQLWLLNAEQLKKLCSKEQLATNGSRNELIQRLAAKYGKSNKKAAVTDMPKDLHKLSNEQLGAVCAAHLIKGASTREDRLDALEELVTGVPVLKDAPKAIQGASKSLAIKDKKSPHQDKNRGVAKVKSLVKGKAKLTPPRNK